MCDLYFRGMICFKVLDQAKRCLDRLTVWAAERSSRLCSYHRLNHSQIGEYTTSGATVNPALISGLADPEGIAVVSTVPEPSSLTLTLVGLIAGGLVFRNHLVLDTNTGIEGADGR